MSVASALPSPASAHRYFLHQCASKQTPVSFHPANTVAATPSPDASPTDAPHHPPPPLSRYRHPTQTQSHAHQAKSPGHSTKATPSAPSHSFQQAKPKE